jgi:TolB-like protein/tetratricopeptide (TPR) repeat protein
MDSLRDQLQAALNQTYRIDRELGGGGMSRVFLATETALDRRVVLKVLPTDLAGGVSVDRFKREISTAARLQHAHIVPLLSAGDAGGLPWFSMPFVEGDTLRARLKSGELPLGEVVRTLRDVASALAYAHGRGVVHRDIKPDNILVADGVASVTDFGVAKAIAEAGAGQGATLTSVGVALGTPAYMAPEQVAADERTDHRADIYALGLVGYEMLSGHNPFAGRGVQATFAAQMSETPAPIESLRTSTPPALARLVARCMAKSAADRPQSATEIVQELDAIATPSGGTAPYTAASTVAYPATRSRRAPWLIAAGLVILAAGGAFAAWRARGPVLDPRTIAVLPFEANAADAPVAEAARIAADWLMQGIAQTDSVNVVANTTVNFEINNAKAKGAEVIDHVAAATRAATIVTGSASRLGDSLRIQVSIVDARTHQLIRAIDPVSGPIADPIIAINAMRDKVLGSIVSGDVARRVAIAGQPPSYAAYREYVQGFTVYRRDQAAARPYMRRAIALDPTFAPPYLVLAASFSNAAQYDSAAVVVASLERLRTRLGTLDRLVLDDMQGSLAGDYELEFRSTAEFVKRSDDGTQLWQHGRAALLTLRVDSAIVVLERTDSGSAQNRWQPNMTRLADAYHLAGKHQRELTYLDLARLRYPDEPSFVNRRLRAHGALQDYAAAIALADTILRAMPNPSSVVGLNAISAGAWEFEAHGDSASARKLMRLALDWTTQHAPPKPDPLWQRAVGRAYLDLGVLDSAESHLTLALGDTSGAKFGTVGYLASIAVARGDTARARAVVDSFGLIRRRFDRGLIPFWRASITASFGDRQRAMTFLRAAMETGQEPVALHYLPALKSLRGYPPFEALIAPRK